MINQETLKKFLQGKTTFTKGLSDILNSLKEFSDAHILFEFLSSQKEIFQNGITKNNEITQEMERLFCLLLCLLWKYPDYCAKKNKEIYELFQSLYSAIKKAKGSFSQGLHAAIDAMLETFSNLSPLQKIGFSFSFTSSDVNYLEYKGWFDTVSQPNDAKEKVIAYLFGESEEIISSEPPIKFKDILQTWESLNKKSKQETACLSAFQKFTLQKFLHLSLLTYTDDFIIWAQTENSLFQALSQQLPESSLFDFINIEKIRAQEFFKSLPNEHPFYRALYPKVSLEHTLVNSVPPSSLPATSLSFPPEDSSLLLKTSKVASNAFSTLISGISSTASNFSLPVINNLISFPSRDSASSNEEPSSLSSASSENHPLSESSVVAPVIDVSPSSQTLDSWAQTRQKITRSLPTPYATRNTIPNCEHLQCARTHLQEKLLVLCQQESNQQNLITTATESIICTTLAELKNNIPLVHAEDVIIPHSENEAKYKALQIKKNACWSRFSQNEFSNWGNFNVKLKEFLKEIVQLEFQYESEAQDTKFSSLTEDAQLGKDPEFQNAKETFYTNIAKIASNLDSFVLLSPSQLKTKLKDVKSLFDIHHIIYSADSNFDLEKFIVKTQSTLDYTPLSTGAIPQEVKALFAHFDTEISRYLLKKDQEDTHTKKRIAQLKMIKTHCLYQTTQYYLSTSKEKPKSSIQRILSKTLDYYAKEFNVSQCKPGTMKSWLCCFKSTTANHLKSKAAELQHQNIEYMVNSTNI